MGLLLSNYKHVETKIEWNHGANSNQLYRPEGSLTGGKASPADSMGKTQLVLAYEKRHRDEYSAVFWINSKNIDTLKQGYLAAASRIYREHPSLLHLRTVAEGSNLDDAVNAVKRWLSHSVTVMGRSRSRVAGLVLLSRFVEHLLPKLHHRYVMKVDPAAASLRGQHTEQNTIAEYMTYWQ
jgi:hypothetical protein